MLTVKGKTIRAEIPRELALAIMRIEVEEDLDWVEACRRAAMLIERGGEEFEKAVRREAQRIYNSRFMKQLNKARDTIWEEGYETGYEDGRREYAIWYYCNVCGKPIYGRPNAESHKAIIEYMRQHGWSHVACHESR